MLVCCLSLKANFWFLWHTPKGNTSKRTFGEVRVILADICPPCQALQSIENKVNSTARFSTRLYIFFRPHSFQRASPGGQFPQVLAPVLQLSAVVSWEFPVVTPKAWRKHTVRCPRRAAFAKAVPKEEESNRTQHWGPETQSRLLHHRKILGCGNLASWILNLQRKSMKQIVHVRFWIAANS